jgi:hypothetical protein
LFSIFIILISDSKSPSTSGSIVEGFWVIT